MKRIGLSLLILLVGIILLTGCNCCPTCPSSDGLGCSLKIITGVVVWDEYTKNVWGTVYINFKSTGQEIDYETNPVAIIDEVPCNQKIYVSIVDSGGCESHIEEIFTVQGENILYFDYF